MARLGDICSIYTGTGFPTQYQGETSGDYPFYKVGDISKNVTKGNTYLKDCDNYITADVAKKIKGTIIPADTVVFAKIGEAVKLNRRAITSQNCLVDNNAMGICPNQTRLNLSYFYHYMCNIKLETYAEATTVPSVKKSVIENLEIPLPTYEEQSNIASVLDAVGKNISLRNQQLEKLDQLVKSRFIELFGSQCHNEKNYPYGKIDDVAEIYLGLTHTPEYIETGVKFISAKNTSCDYLDLSDVKYISKEEYASAPAGAKPQKGDVLFSRVGSNLGHPVILDIDEELCTFVSLGYLRTKGRVTNLYLKHWMRDDFFAEQVRRKVVGGGQPNLNTGWLKEFRIIIPPMDIQEQFAAFVEQTDKSKLAIQQSLEKLETLKKALMQKYFG